MNAQPPVILLVYANDRVDPSRHLRNLSAEIGLIRDALQPAEQAGLCQVLIEANAGADRIFSVFQDARYRSRIAVLHYAGHADEYRLLLESAAGGTPSDQGAAHAAGLAAFLGEQRGLQLVFLNGCSTAPQVQGLLDVGCPAVIATSQAIDDGVATEFAARFYQGLGGGVGLESAFKAAVAAARTTHGDSPRGLYWGSATEPAPLAERWPWEFHTKPGAEQAQHWNLPEAADDPLFGLPALPRLDLPTSPFRHLSWFDREHAEVFFGRPFQVRALFERITAPDAPPILLLYGQSGVGKSSVLAAGLLPRLEASHRVHYLRRDPALGLFGTLMQPLGAGVDEPGAAWRQAETDAQAPLLLILDQVEEVFTRPAAKPAAELDTFLAGLQAIFGQSRTRPRGRLILSFRKEWLPEIEARLADQCLPPRGRLFLEGLDRRGIIAAVEGPTRGDRLRNAYGLQIDAGLAAEIADDLLADPDSPIAPTLQILLTKLWAEARWQDDARPRFTRELYLKLKRDGILLKDFLDQQLAALEQWRPAVVQSGLALDLLAAHTTPTGTADQRTEQELLTSYAQVPETLPALLQRCKDGYLLTDIPTARQEPVKGTRLAHDTIAPLVRARFEASDRPGQRARRILENRVMEWRDGKAGELLYDADLKIVEEGANGMRGWDPDEKRLVDASREEAGRRKAEAERRAREENELRRAEVAARLEATRHACIAIARLQAAEARGIAERYPVRALLLAAEAVKRPLEPDGIRLGVPETVLRECIGATGGIPLNGVNVAAFDPQGRWLATAGDDKLMRLWDLKDPESELRVLRSHKLGVTALAFDPQGPWLAAAGDDKRVRLFDPTDPAFEPHELRGHAGAVTAIAFDPRGRWLATVVDNKLVRLLNLKDPESEPRELSVQGETMMAFAFSPQARWLATGGQEGTLRLWDLEQLEPESRVLSRQFVPIKALVFDPKGRWLASLERGFVGKLSLWDLQQSEAKPLLFDVPGDLDVTPAFDPQGRWLATVVSAGRADTACLLDLSDLDAEPRLLTRHRGRIASLAFDPQGRWLASGSEDLTIRLLDLQDAKSASRVLRGHEGGVESLAFDPAGRWLASRSCDRTMRLWDLEHSDAEPRVMRAYKGTAFAFDPRGRWLATGVDDTLLRLWNLEDPKSKPRDLAGQYGWMETLAFDAQGRRLATLDSRGSMRLFDLQGPDPKALVMPGLVDGISGFAFDSQGRWLAAGVNRQTAYLWDLEQPDIAPQELPGHVGPIRTLAFDPRGRWLATAGESDEAVRLWDLGLQHPQSRQPVLRGHSGFRTFAFDRNGRWLAILYPYGEAAELWDLDQSASEPRLLDGHGASIGAVAFDREGRRLSTGGYGNGTAHLWDLQDPMSKSQELRGHQVGINDLAFDPQGRWLATAGKDNTVRLWRLDRPGTEPVVLTGQSETIRLAFDSQGRWLATGNSDDTVRLWQLDVQVLLDLACRTAGRNLTDEEWRQHVGESPSQVTCPPSDEAAVDGAAAEGT